MIKIKEANEISSITLEGVIASLKKTNLIKQFNISDVSVSKYAVTFNISSKKISGLSLGHFEVYTNGDIDFMLYNKAIGGIFTLNKKDYVLKLSEISKLTEMCSDYENNLKSLILYLIQ